MEYLESLRLTSDREWMYRHAEVVSRVRAEASYMISLVETDGLIVYFGNNFSFRCSVELMPNTATPMFRWYLRTPAGGTVSFSNGRPVPHGSFVARYGGNQYTVEVLPLNHRTVERKLEVSREERRYAEREAKSRGEYPLAALEHVTDNRYMTLYAGDHARLGTDNADDIGWCIALYDGDLNLLAKSPYLEGIYRPFILYYGGVTYCLRVRPARGKRGKGKSTIPVEPSGYLP